jgi:hypothetical protein
MSTIKLKHSGGNSVSLNPPTSAPTSSEVAFKLPTSDGSAGQVLKTDGSGNLSWVDNPAPDYVKIDRQSNGGVASALIFDNLDVATFKFFDLMLTFVPESDNHNTYFRFRTGGASGADVSTSKYDYGYNETYPSDTHGGKAAGDVDKIRLSGGIGSNTGQGEGFRLNLRIMFADTQNNGTQTQRCLRVKFVNWCIMW